jgi:hypothetical protein
VLAALVIATVTAIGASDARAEAVWRFAPAQAPPAPEGVAPAPYPVPVGEVGDISFWAPNRGLLITGGTEGPAGGPVAAGLYAYDGSGWHQLATVCGGAEGRIAWAGPDEFWTISDQRPGQVLPPGGQTSLQSISLCHFRNGEVVGSYATPLEEAGSYLHMNAAACYGPNDCWFGGADGATPNVGAFHLHWDGSAVTTVYEPEDHAVTGMVEFAGELYEGVQIGGHDAFLASEQPEHPAVLHSIAPAGVAPTFEDVATFSQTEHKRLPEYGKGVQPDALQGFDLATDGAQLGVGATQLWAAANPLVEPPHGSNAASLTVLRLVKGPSESVWSQIAPQLAPGSRLAGATGRKARESGTSGAIAPEPGGGGAWLSLRSEGRSGAAVAHLQPDGQVDRTENLPAADEPVGYRGDAGPIACPAAHDCWLATAAEAGTTSGWLFHMTDGTRLTQNTDPFFDGQDPVIASRPPDGGVPVVYPDLPPVDNSLANQLPPIAPAGPPMQIQVPTKRKQARRLVERIKSKFLHRRELVVSFTLTARAHVQLLGRRKHKIVASTRRESLTPGRHELSLRLNPASWPTAMQFKATPIGASAPTEGGSGGSEAGNTIGT